MVVGLSACGKEEATAGKEKEVTSTDGKITLTVPADFNVNEKSSEDELVLAAENAKQSVGAYVYKLDKSPMMTFNEFSKKYAELSTSAITDVEDTTIDGKPAKIGNLQEDGKFRVAMINISDESIYLVMAGASEEDLYDAEAMQSIISSIEINAD